MSWSRVIAVPAGRRARWSPCPLAAVPALASSVGESYDGGHRDVLVLCNCTRGGAIRDGRAEKRTRQHQLQQPTRGSIQNRGERPRTIQGLLDGLTGDHQHLPRSLAMSVASGVRGGSGKGFISY
ncbi:unnamed protein product [Lampetra planeri]